MGLHLQVKSKLFSITEVELQVRAISVESPDTASGHRPLCGECSDLRHPSPTSCRLRDKAKFATLTHQPPGYAAGQAPS